MRRFFVILLLLAAFPATAQVGPQNVNQAQAKANAAATAEATRTADAPLSSASLLLPPSTAAQTDLCADVSSGAFGSLVSAFTFNLAHIDPNCRMIRDAKMMQQLGQPLAAIQIMCAKRDIRRAMSRAGTPCRDQHK